MWEENYGLAVRRVAAAVMLTVLAAAFVSAVRLERGAGSADPARAEQSSSLVTKAGGTDPLAVLRAWDKRRAKAWAKGDTKALEQLYEAGSQAGERDVLMLSGYVDVGLRVEGMTTQVIESEVVQLSGSRIVLEVTDRIVGGVAVGATGSTTLPRGKPAQRRVTLVRTKGGWVVSAVSRLD
jgi:hypothetical protein